MRDEVIELLYNEETDEDPEVLVEEHADLIEAADSPSVSSF